MTSDDVTDGCAPKDRVLAPCEICAASLRLKKIERQVLESNIMR